MGSKSGKRPKTQTQTLDHLIQTAICLSPQDISTKKSKELHFYQLQNKLRPKSGVGKEGGREAGSEEEVWEK